MGSFLAAACASPLDSSIAKAKVLKFLFCILITPEFLKNTLIELSLSFGRLVNHAFKSLVVRVVGSSFLAHRAYQNSRKFTYRGVQICEASSFSRKIII
jgi:hypothetical protein